MSNTRLTLMISAVAIATGAITLAFLPSSSADAADAAPAAVQKSADDRKPIPKPADLKLPGLGNAPAGDGMDAMDAMDAPASKGGTTRPKLTKQESEFFESKVRPILVGACYKCHSVEEKKAKGGLVLDSRDGWHKGGENGTVIVPGKPEQSKLLVAVKYADNDLQMPPNGNKLSDQQIAVLEQWVKMGAPDPREAAPDGKGALTGLTDQARAHWAYQPVKPQAVPEVKTQGEWVKTPVDAFVLAKLQQNKMTPSAPAARETLIRRATYDLTGLPPTPEEVAAFVNDQSPDAFEKVVERLLASPHYGERWGRYWLDTARYSDTTGGENRREEYRYPYAWTYRDYVISSLNADKPYDQFLKEQLAADLLPQSKDDPSILAALGFITVGKRFQNPNDTIDERIDAVTKSTLASTVACARCHDHKFDPVPTADYYSLHGIFNSITEPADKPLIGAEPAGPQYEDFKRQVAELEAYNRDAYYKIVTDKGAEFRKKPGAYLLAAAMGRGRDAETIKARNNVIEQNKLDRDLYQGGLRNIRPQDPVLGPIAILAQAPADQFEKRFGELYGRMLATLKDQDTDSRTDAERQRDRDRAKRGKFDGPGRGGRFAINKVVARAFADADPRSFKSIDDVVKVYADLFAKIAPDAERYIEDCRNATGKTEMTGYDDALVELYSIPARIEPAGALDTQHLKEIAPLLPIVNQGAYNRLALSQVTELIMTHPASPARAMVVADAEKPKDSPIFIRGEAGNRGKVVPRQFLEVLAGKDRKPFTKGSGRLELAEAIASKDNPLTARVMVNRVWMHHFGQAFVRTPDDLGVQSEAPSHPELLDYLAGRFVQEGWSLKKLHRLIMLSSTYQQSSDTNASYAKQDPENRLLWRANLRRLDFEAVRDTMLVFTGKLDQTLGGKPVNLTDEPYSNRRSVYGYIDRGDVPELMSQFDFADPDMANSKRATTIVPQQALFFMNSPMAVDVARKAVTRPEFVEAKDNAERVKALYEVLYQRAPRPDEVRFAMEFLQSSGAGAEVASAADPSPKAPADTAEQTRRERKRLARMEAEKKQQQAQLKVKRGAGRGAISNQGDRVERRPLTVWEQYAQALLFTNEIAYVN